MLILLGLCTLCAVIWIYADRFITNADQLYEFLQKNYSKKLLELKWQTRISFPLHWMAVGTNMGIKHGVLYQFKILKIIEKFNPTDAKLQKTLQDTRTKLKKVLFIISIFSFGVFLIVIYFGMRPPLLH